MKNSRISKVLDKYKYPLLVLFIGAALLLIPTGGGDKSRSLQQGEEERIAQMLERSEGVGSADVLLSEKGAIIVCDGAADPVVRLNVIEAVEAYTGLGCDKIQVLMTRTD